jgi:hypothetical protein
LLVRFKVEEHRLLNWAKLVQLDYRDDKLVLNHMSKGLIINIMEQQQKLLFSFGRLNKKYEKLTDPLLVEEVQVFVLQNSDRLIENGANGADDSNKSVQFPPTEELVKMSLKFVQQFKDVPKRLKWATFDHQKMEALIAKLADFNDKMHEALDKAQMDLLIDMQTRTNDQIVLLNRTMSHMVQIYQSQQSEQIGFRRQYSMIEMEDSEYDGLIDSGAITARGAAHQPLAALAQQNFIHLAIEGSQVDLTQSFAREINMPDLPNDIRQSQTELLFEDIRPKQGSHFPLDIDEGVRTEAFYNNTPVWVEWKTDATGPMHQDGGVDSKILKRVQKLAALLSKNNRTVRFRAPFCRGYFIDEEEGRFGLVFEKPASVPADTEPTALHALITNPANDIPSLTDRITLMLLLAETVERLHAVDWLHKGLRSANILLFPKKGGEVHNGRVTKGEINYADPFISGFDYSRPATSDDMTERPLDNPAADIYRHPSVQHKGNREDASGRESYKKSFDLYSLGIVLLEIAHWKTIDQILSINLERARPKDTWTVRERLLTGNSEYLRFVKSYLGNTVEGVVRACLMGPEAFGLDREADEKREVVAAQLQRAFGDVVVRRLACMKGL